MALLVLPLTGWGQQELRSGKKGNSNPAPITSTSIDADHQALDVNISGGTLGDVTISNADGAINDGVNNTIKGTVLDLTNSNPVTTAIVDANGDQITSFGGGTQYQQGTASTTTDTMTMAGCVRVDTPAVATGVIDGDRARCMVDSTGRLWVHVGVIDGTVGVTQSGTWNLNALTSITNPVAVTGTFWQATQPVSGTVTANAGTGTFTVGGTVAATQSGTWTVQPGNTANTTPWLATIAQGGNSATVNGSGQLAVNCANCSGSGVSQQDNTGFTPGTTNFVPMGGEVDDTGTTAVTENNAGVARITPQRSLHTNLRNNSGTEVGTSGAPLRIDPTGSTTQPISAASLPLPTGAATAANQDGIIRDGTGDTTQANVSSGSLHVACQSGCSGGTQYAEDTVHVSGDTLTLAGVVRQDSTAALAADGDRTLLQVNANGHLKVVNDNPNLAADNSTLSTAKVPVLPGTVSTSAPTWTSGNQSALSLQTDGSVRAAITNTPTVTANAGTNLNTSALLTTAAHDSAFGTAGTADTQVRTVQGIASMTPLLVNPGTAANFGIYAEDAAETAGGNLSMAGSVRRDTAASSAGAAGDNATINTDANGLLWSRTLDPCTALAKTFIPINITTATTTELTPSLAGASTNYYVCSLNLVTAAANNVALADDDTDNCASVTSGLAGGTTAGSGWNLAANGGLTFGNGAGSVFKTNGANRVLCLVTSAATQLSGSITVVAAP